MEKWNLRLVRWLAALAVALTVVSAHAGQDTVRAAYCLGSNEATLADSPAPSKEMQEAERLFEDSKSAGAGELYRNRLQDNISRLKDYLKVNASKADKKALDLARERGNGDYMVGIRDTKQCMEACNRASDCTQRCLKDSGPTQRMRACQKLDWLPF
ncbi:hypothetical protein QTH97_22820 [Variovorax sp. J22R24]|uniref:hypothetical protein n=1 Tax=Variovorax gracilis TaxID=3053502 RepID=UPI0025762BA3|nr:hypothetical protein [Variovorax sp. J22R24]MDM0107797.1 hypothetical protein [Variovorax sp. J22R24]